MHPPSSDPDPGAEPGTDPGAGHDAGRGAGAGPGADPGAETTPEPSLPPSRDRARQLRTASGVRADDPDPRAVTVIGPGRVGTAVALALRDAGHRIVGVAGRGEASLAAFAERFPEAAQGSPAQVCPLAGLVVVAVADDALPEVVRAAARDDAVVPGSRWVHVSGAHGLDVLRPARLAGARTAAVHPAQTFPDADAGREALPGTAWAVTADGDDLGWASVLVGDLRGTPVAVADDRRGLYHAGLTVGSNATTGVVSLARELLKGAGVDDPMPFLSPIALRSAEGGAQRGVAALTGPVRRGDAGTVATHLEELERDWPEAAGVYRALAQMLLTQSRRAGLDPELAQAVQRVLDEQGLGDDEGEGGEGAAGASADE